MTEQEYMTLKRRYKAEAEEAERADRGSDTPAGSGSGAHARKTRSLRPSAASGARML